MRIGDRVIYLADPLLYGPGIYVDSTRDGRMIVEFADGTREIFRPIELDSPEFACVMRPQAHRVAAPAR